ncbi:MAG: hypothetical protein KDC35_06500 [Acidobacteria bacterium]|nr:hypothetical protein [Acidobacteriota bacterium]
MVFLFALLTQVSIAPENEPGTALILEGQVTNIDGQPIADAEVTAWHTDAKGYYGEDASGVPRLKATAVTDSSGWYHFKTIRPGGYAGENMAAHVHFEVKATGHTKAGATIHFADDPRVSKEQAKQAKSKGFFSDILVIETNTDGIQTGRRDFRLQ